MAEHTEPTADTETEGGEGAASAPAKKKFGLKQIVLFVVLPLLLLGGGGAAAFFMLHKTEKPPENAAMAVPDKEAPEDPKAPPVFMPLPDMIVNLQNERGKSTFLKITMGLELSKQEDVAKVTAVLPRIMDAFQLYLRELHVDELRGSAGLYRLREELLMRVQQVVAPIKVRDVLFKEMLVQ